MTDLLKTSSDIIEKRETLGEIEEFVKAHEQVEMPVKDHFSKDLYARELFIPAGTLLVGKIHKHQSLNILAQGDISLLTEEGVKRVQAPYTIVSKPGIKRVGYAHTDCTWITAHATKETDVEKIEEEVIAKNYDDVQEITNKEIELLLESGKEEICLG